MVPSPLQAIIDADAATAAGWRPTELAARYLDGGARWLQIRAKGLPGREFLELCDAVVTLGGACGATVLVNDRADFARLSGAAGVHLGQEDLSPAAARTVVGPAAMVGWSTHTPAQLADAARQPISYVAVGPVFGTTTKDTGYDAVGLELVRAAVAAAAGRPVVAIGGVTLDRAPSVLRAGAAAVAVITDLVTADPSARVRAYLDALDGR